ncbi:GNAT family N-acetyltransferase [Microbacterium stercoris]|uniref:GNAT family N-acetyltransferase n=1 Tax=Microbacterium stercoris TaxID=2820289 RepID=A0A939QPC5_9MICO|nr:GNAT family N-acetyltransferase [Microbacterium stercoris]MBO3663081.1 GNAT family N-acetyltransferase [Microbacterium stercoris]
MQTLADGAILRRAIPADVPGIFDRIVELAIYEREPDAVTSTPELLHASLFGENPNVFARVVESDGEVAGIAIWFLNYSTWTGRNGLYLEDLIVKETHRGRGYGLALMKALARECVEKGHTRFEWTVLDWNEPSIRFYRQLGAKGQDEWTVQRVDGEALAALAAD